jgi:hypothetical protein
MESRAPDKNSSIESKKKFTAAEFDETIRKIFAKHGISRKSNFLLYLCFAFKIQINDTQIDSIITGEADVFFDEELQKLRLPILDFITHKDMHLILQGGNSFTLERDQIEKSTVSDITRQHKYIYIDVDEIVKALSDLEKAISDIEIEVRTKFKLASDALLLKGAMEAVDVAFKPFDKACLTHMPAVGSDLDTVLQLVSNMRQCFDHLPDKYNCEFSAAELFARCQKFEYLVHRLLPFVDEAHLFAKSNTDEFGWLVALKKAGDFYKANCATTRIADALQFQQQLGEYLIGHGVKASAEEAIFGGCMAYGKRFETYTSADYSYKPSDPTYIYLSFHLVDENHCQAIRDHLLAMDDKKEMHLFEVGKPSNNHGFYEMKVRSTDALNILLPKFKEIFEKKLKEDVAEITQYQGVESPKVNRKWAIAFFDPQADASKQQQREFRRHRHGK